MKNVKINRNKTNSSIYKSINNSKSKSGINNFNKKEQNKSIKRDFVPNNKNNQNKIKEIKMEENKIKLEQPKENLVENTRYDKDTEKVKKILEEKEEKIEEEESKIIGADEICSDFRKYIKIFIESICKSYDELIGGDSSKNQAARRDKVGSMISNVKKEERDLNINKFLDKFIENGKANIIKEKLKKFIIKIALEKYKKKIEFTKEN